MEHFASILRAKNYAPSTIHSYIGVLRGSGVNLRNRHSVRRALNDDSAIDRQGDRFRAFLAYDRFLHNNNLPGGRSKVPSTMTLRDACLRQTTRADVDRVYWLVKVRGYKPLTATTYVNLSKKEPGEDRHRNVHRARMSLKEYGSIPIEDVDILDYYNSLDM
jgi:hypothetical protein